jgi:3-oxoacyl-[acyl-carrier protein] reductase
MNLGIADHVALVTGAGRGLGAGITTALAREGVYIICLDRDTSANEQTQRLIDDGARAQPVIVDVTDPVAVTTAVELLRKELGHIEILVNCAGFSRDAPITELTDEAWNAVVDVNLNGAFYVTRAVVRAMKEQQYGRIVNISSRAWRGDDCKANYSAAKAGLVGFTGALAIELGKANITVNAIAPGFVETERVRELPYFDSIHERALTLSYTTRLGEPEDVASLVAYLSSVHAGFLTGEVVTVAGGRLR